MKDKNEGSSTELLSEGLSSEMKIKDIQTIRGETSEESQRPVSSKETISSDRGSFTTK